MRKNNSYIWCNNQILIDKGANAPLLHILHNTGVCEIIRVYNGSLFMLDKHIERLFLSAKALMIEISFSVDQVKHACLSIIELNKIDNGSIRPSISLTRNQQTSKTNIEILITHKNRTNTYSTNLSDKKALKINISSFIKPLSQDFLYSIQSSALCVLNHLAKKKSVTEGYDDSLILDCRRFIADATASNFFLIKNNIIYTPTTECCINGITRELILGLAQKEGIKTVEKHLTTEELLDSDEAFLCNTSIEINPIASIENKIYHNNPISQFLYSKFYQLTQEIT